ncbi:arabinose-proton symporter [Salmonella enterica subsp. enterica]|uniref:Arabinose-proton symporter n=1 Tax=Salmonella enterica I TaxID=59201 RepID=A0A3S4IH40_SALET|nr:arabinose-proton symporter [Salmonella enterica subsp. enterica]
MAGFTTTEQQMIATLVVGLTFMFATFIAVFTVDKAGRKPALKIGFSVMALGTLVLGYCLMQFDNGTASSGLSWLFRWDDDDVYRRLRDERRSGGVDTVFGNPAAEMPWIFGITCSTTTNWGSNMIIGADIPDSVGQHWRGRYILALHRAEYRFYRHPLSG